MPKKGKKNRVTKTLYTGTDAEEKIEEFHRKAKKPDLYKTMKKGPKYQILYQMEKTPTGPKLFIYLLYFQETETKRYPVPSVMRKRTDQIHYLLWDLISVKILPQSLKDILANQEDIRQACNQRVLLTSWFDSWAEEEKKPKSEEHKAWIQDWKRRKYENFWRVAGTNLLYSCLDNLELFKVLEPYVDVSETIKFPEIEKVEMLRPFHPEEEETRHDVKLVSHNNTTREITDSDGSKERIKTTELQGDHQEGYKTKVRHETNAVVIRLKSDPLKGVHNQAPEITTIYDWKNRYVSIITKPYDHVQSQIPQGALSGSGILNLVTTITNIESIQLGQRKIVDTLDIEMVLKFGWDAVRVCSEQTIFESVMSDRAEVERPLLKHLLKICNPFSKRLDKDWIVVLMLHEDTEIIEYFSNHYASQFFNCLLEEKFYETCFKVLLNSRSPFNFHSLCEEYPEDIQRLVFREMTDPTKTVKDQGCGLIVNLQNNGPEDFPISLSRFEELYQKYPELILTLLSKIPESNKENLITSLYKLLEIAFHTEGYRSPAINFLVSHIRNDDEILKLCPETLKSQLEEYELEHREETISREVTVDHLEVENEPVFIDKERSSDLIKRAEILLTELERDIEEKCTFTESLSLSTGQRMREQSLNKQDILKQERPQHINPGTWINWLSNCIDRINTKDKIQKILEKLSSEISCTDFESLENDIIRKEETFTEKKKTDGLLKTKIETSLRESAKRKTPSKSKKESPSTKKTALAKEAPTALPKSKSDKPEKPHIVHVQKKAKTEQDIRHLIEPFFTHEFAYCCGDQDVRHILIMRFLVLLQETERKNRIRWDSICYARNLYIHYGFFLEKDIIDSLIDKLAEIQQAFLEDLDFNSMKELLQDFVDTANELGNESLERKHRVQLFRRNDAITFTHQDVARTICMSDHDLKKRRDKRFAEITKQIRSLGEISNNSERVKQKLLMIELGEHSKADESISKSANQIFGETVINRAKYERNKLLHKYSTMSDSGKPIQSALLQACNIPMQEVECGSPGGLGLFDEKLGDGQEKGVKLKLPLRRDEPHEEESTNLEGLRLFGVTQEGRNQKKLSPREAESATCDTGAEHENEEDAKRTTLTSKSGN